MNRLLGLVVSTCIAAAIGCAHAPDEQTDDSGNAVTAAPCNPPPACTGGPGPELAPTTPWKAPRTEEIARPHVDHHRGRDMIVVEGQQQWVIGKFAYGVFDQDLKGEDVDIFVERDCGGTWEKLGTATTTYDDQHPTVEGVKDSGGRIYFEIPADKALREGRHRVRLVVSGDHTYADMLFDVVRKDTPILVSDVDGTLTSSEYVEFQKLMEGHMPSAQPGAATVLSDLAAKGLHPVYLTARPEWLTARTQEFLQQQGFPPGIIHTTTTVTGALGPFAMEFKKGELEQLSAKGLNVQWAFGNQPSDTIAYHAANFAAAVHRIFLHCIDKDGGGRTINSYSELLPDIAGQPAECEAR